MADAYEAAIREFLVVPYGQEVPEPIYLGIDPGLEGAIALVQRARCAVVDIPVIQATRTKVRKLKAPAEGGPKTQKYKGSDNWYDEAAILGLFRLLAPFRNHIEVAIEKAQVMNKAKLGNTPLTGWKTGAGWNMWPLFLKSQGYAVHNFTPSVWKPRLGLQGKDKEASRALALSLYPRADIGRKKDHDRAEALLLAHVLKLQLGGGAAPKKKARSGPETRARGEA